MSQLALPFRRGVVYHGRELAPMVVDYVLKLGLMCHQPREILHTLCGGFGHEDPLEACELLALGEGAREYSDHAQLLPSLLECGLGEIACVAEGRGVSSLIHVVGTRGVPCGAASADRCVSSPGSGVSLLQVTLGSFHELP